MTTAKFNVILYPTVGFAAKYFRNSSRCRAITSVSSEAAARANLWGGIKADGEHCRRDQFELKS